MQRALLSSDAIIVAEEKATIRKKVVFKRYCQDQDFLLPKSIGDFVTPGHIARLISGVVDKMDIDPIIETYLGGGTSSYNPRMLLKAWCLGFANRTYSCRLLAKALRENLTFIWVSGNQAPDFHTLNNFRLRLRNGIKTVFKEVIRYGLELGIIDGRDVFVDHTKTAANANRYKVVWKKQVWKQSKKIDEELEQLFDYIDRLNEEENRIFGNADLPELERSGFDDGHVRKIIDRINKKMKDGALSHESGKDAKKKVRRTKELLDKKQQYETKKEILGARNSYSRTDTDSVAMMMKDKLTIGPAYNEGVAVQNGFVLNYVISNNAADNVSFIPLMDGVISNLGRVPENSNGDAAYGNEENHSFLERKGIGNFLKYNTHHQEKTKKWKEKIRLEDFRYDENADEFTCRNNVRLKLVDEYEKTTATGYKRQLKKYRAEGDCARCPFKAACTESGARTLEVSWKGERLKRQARLNLASEKGLELRKRRGNEVESIFGDGKLNKGKQRYLLRGLSKVNVEAGLYYISHNMRKIHAFLPKMQKQPNRPDEKITDNPVFSSIRLQLAAF